jgi:hypothetical protein
MGSAILPPEPPRERSVWPAILQAIAGRCRPTAIDVGIDTGRQIGVPLDSRAAAESASC